MIRGRARFVLTQSAARGPFRPRHVNTALSVHDLWFGYRRGGAVRGVSLQVAPGDCYGFLGHNGAGKTTVMRLCLGLLRPQRGQVQLFGIDARREPRRARAQVGALVERPGFHLGATARQNLVWLGQLQGLTRPLARAAAAHALDRCGLDSAGDRRVGTFSLGMRQRLGIAQALLGTPRLLLLDEPTNGLDPEGIAELRTLLRQLSRDEGVAVFLSSHQLQELEGLCTRIGVLREGRMVVEGDVATLRAGFAARQVVQGTPLSAFAARLAELRVPFSTEHDRLLVDLRSTSAGKVARELAAIGELSTFAAEPVTLETIYLRATQQPADPPSVPSTPTPAEPLGPTDARPDAPRAPVRRAFGHEMRTLLGTRSLPFLLLPATVAAWSVFAYRSRVAQGLARVQSGELFSADAGSGQLATAQALQAATPVLALGLLWFASQAIAADLARDTLRNTLVRSVARPDVLLGKFLALTSFAGAGWLLTFGTALGTAAATLGLHDLEEVSRGGDRQVLAAATDVTPALAAAFRHGLLPLLGIVATGLATSLLARRPARALVFALAAVLLPELLRPRLGEHAGWLLTSHLPTGLRDDSVLGWCAAIARGAADANWPWQPWAVLAPLAWIATSFLFTLLLFRRLRVA